MYGLPDSAVYGTYKRIRGRKRRRTTSSTGLIDMLIYWVDSVEKKEKAKAKRRKKK